MLSSAILFKEDPSVCGKHERLDAGDAYVLKKIVKSIYNKSSYRLIRQVLKISSERDPDNQRKF